MGVEEEAIEAYGARAHQECMRQGNAAMEGDTMKTDLLQGVSSKFDPAVGSENSGAENKLGTEEARTEAKGASSLGTTLI